MRHRFQLSPLWIANVIVICGLFATACPFGEPPPASREGQEDVADPDPCAPVAELARLDHRTSVPLQPMMAWHQKQNMMAHLVAIQRIADGLARDDWEEIASASALIGSSPQMQQMCRHMGAGADGFTAAALDFHRRADAIGEAAREHDGAAVLRATSSTLQACTACHATFRQEVVDTSEWQRRTGQRHDFGADGGP